MDTDYSFRIYSLHTDFIKNARGGWTTIHDGDGQTDRQTDRQSDRWTDTGRHPLRLRIASRGKIDNAQLQDYINNEVIIKTVYILKMSLLLQYNILYTFVPFDITTTTGVLPIVIL